MAVAFRRRICYFKKGVRTGKIEFIRVLVIQFFKIINAGFLSGFVIENGHGIKFRVMETPGHSRGSVTLKCEDALFTGDTLFAGECGRADLPGGDFETLMASLRRLGDLPGNYEVWPGHMDPSTLDIEKANNYYMRYAKGI